MAQIDHVVDYVLGEGLGTDTTNEGLIDLEVVHMELLQIDQAGVAGAEIIHGQLDPHLVQCLEQREGMGIRHQQLPLGQLQHQRHLARCEAGEEAAALLQQAVVAAMGRTDVEADVEAIGQLRLACDQLLPHPPHDEAGHGHYQAASLRLGNEEIWPDQPHVRMLPAHQHLDPHDAFAAALHQGLQVGDELFRPQGPGQLAGRGAGAPQQPPHEHGNTGTEGKQQPDPEAMMTPQPHQGGSRGVACIDGERIASSLELDMLLTRQGRRGGEEVALLVEPAIAHPEHQGHGSLVEAQHEVEVIPIDQGHHGPLHSAGAHREDGMMPPHLVPFHQAQLALTVLLGGIGDPAPAKLGGTVDAVPLAQVDRTHEGHHGDQGSEGRQRSGAGLAQKWQGLAIGRLGMRQHGLHQRQGMARRLMGFPLQIDPIANEHGPVAEQHGQREHQQGDQQSWPGSGRVGRGAITHGGSRS
ncbi:hypothetical protein D3C77_308910 [compost metagenome]